MKLKSSSWIFASLALATGAFAQAPEKEWPRHSMERPRPPVVEPKYDGAAVPAPEGALVLFDGTSLEDWKSGNEPAKWQLVEGNPSAMQVTRGGGSLRCELPLEGDGHLHIEWATPAEVKGEGQGRGNSGVFLDGFPEIQVLDSHENDTYPDGQAAALYGVRPPAANASRKPGEWQAYDIVFERSGDDPKKMLLSVTHNGVKVHDRVEIDTSVERRFLSLQDHGDPMRFRNIWFKQKSAK
jgi:hypothetical protein